MHRAVQAGWEPPDSVSEEHYGRLHAESLDGKINARIAFVGFGCSWGGKWWGGYGRGDDRNFCQESKLALLRKHKFLKKVTFQHNNYRSLEPRNLVIYCDPPYAGTTGYGTEWDASTFWDRMRLWSQHNTVLISEYKAPSDFKCFWSAEHFSCQGTNCKATTERLFVHAIQLENTRC